MTGDATGALALTARGQEWTLYLGMSVLARVQAKHGDAFNALLNGDTAGLPNLAVIHDLFMGALQRYHADEADEYLVDEIIRDNAGAIGALMTAASPEPSAEGKAPAKASRRR
jgi:hypothetical protein